MKSETLRCVVLGARGRIGRYIVARAIAEGADVSAVTRGPLAAGDDMAPGVRWAALAAADREGHRRLFDAADLVIDARNQRYDDWSGYPAMIGATLAALEQTSARYLYVDNFYCYGRPGPVPVTEDAPRLPVSAKGAVRATVEEMLVRAMGPDRDVLIVRFPDFYGPGVGPFETLDRGRLRWYGPPALAHQFVDLDDAARAVWALATDEDAFGQVWHVCGPPPISGDDLRTLAATVLERPIRLETVGTTAVWLLGLVNPLARGFRETRYLWDDPLFLDGGKFSRRYPDFAFRSHTAALEAVRQEARGRRRA